MYALQVSLCWTWAGRPIYRTRRNDVTDRFSKTAVEHRHEHTMLRRYRFFPKTERNSLLQNESKQKWYPRPSHYFLKPTSSARPQSKATTKQYKMVVLVAKPRDAQRAVTWRLLRLRVRWKIVVFSIFQNESCVRFQSLDSFHILLTSL